MTGAASRALGRRGRRVTAHLDAGQRRLRLGRGGAERGVRKRQAAYELAPRRRPRRVEGHERVRRAGGQVLNK